MEHARRKTRGARGAYAVTGTAKQLAYLEGLVAGKSKRRAAHDAGYKGRPARVVADLDRSAFNQAVHKAAEASGLTLETITVKIKELMDATESKPFLTRDGDIVYAKEQVMADVQLKAVILALDLLGIPRKEQGTVAEGKNTAEQGISALVLAQRYEHLSDAELEDAMRSMQNNMISTGPALPETTRSEEKEY